MRGLRVTVLVVLAGVSSFCSSSEKDSCIPGQQVACACPGNQRGVQVCQSDGKGYAPCAKCGDADASAGASGAGVSGSSGVSGSAGVSGSSGVSGSAGVSGSSGVSGSAGAVASGGASGSAGASDAGDGSSGSAGASGSAGMSGSAGTGGRGGSSGTAGAGGSPVDAGDAGASCPAGSVTSAVTGTCDILRQNCPSPYTCTIVQSGATWRTECGTLGAGSKTLGASCASHSECAIGLRCTSTKCTRPCCPQREAEYCGTGQCDLTINFSGSFLSVCSFSPPCTPWASNCPAGPERDCHIAAGNRFLCDPPNYSIDAGSTIGRSCIYRNDCGDSQYCAATQADASTGTCRWLCKVNNTGAPDAGTVGGVPGQGGCPGGQTCRAFANPSWLGVCLPP